MSNPSQEISTTTEQLEQDKILIEGKRQRWADLGESIHRSEMGLQVQAQNQIIKIELPKSIEQVPAAEKQLTEIKQAQKAIEEQRKKFTVPLQDVCSRLMNPEKSLDPHIKELTGAIIKVKTDYETLQRAKAAKEEELKQIKEKIKSALTQTDHDFRAKISTQVTYALQYALEKGDIKPADLDDYIDRCSKKLGVIDFYSEPPVLNPKYHDLTEINVLMDEIWLCNPHAYVGIYHTQLKEKFVDYAVAYQNKQQALELARIQEEENQKKLQAEKDNKELANKMEAVSVPLAATTVGPQIKALKKSYEVDMPETMENAIKIWSAFVANLELCMPKIRGTKAFSCTPTQLMGALGKVKSEDNLFQPQGIQFKEVNKL